VSSWPCSIRPERDEPYAPTLIGPNRTDSRSAVIEAGRLASSAARGELNERARSGIASAELEWRVRRINLAPADLRKKGPGFDLPIALAILAEVSVALERHNRRDSVEDHQTDRQQDDG
jgi:hypothetical protein